MEIFINGLCLGGVYALIALGYTMVYGIAKMLNFAHGDIIMIGAYVICVTLGTNGVAMLLPTFVASVVVCTILGVVIELCAYRPLRGASPLAVLITAIGVSYLLQSLAQILSDLKLFGMSNPMPFNANISIGGKTGIEVFGSSISYSSIITLLLCTIIMIGLTLFVKKTRIGCAMLAVSEDRGAAQLMGVNVNFIIGLTFAIGSALAAFASLFYLMQIPTVTPMLGSMPGIKAFTAAVIGGIGSIPGAMIGGVLLGIIEKVCQSIPVISPYTTAIEFGLLVVILIVKPTGFLGKKRSEKV